MPEIRIIIGGPPNSDKSTLVNSLKRALWEIGVKVNSAELDLWAPTLEFLEESYKGRSGGSVEEVS